MSTEPTAATERRAQLRQQITEDLGIVARYVALIEEAHDDLTGQGSDFLFDPDFHNDKHFRRALEQLSLFAAAARQLNPATRPADPEEAL